MRLQTFKRLFRGDFESQFQNFVDKLSFPFNQIESLFQAVSGNISLQDNISCTVKDVSVAVDSEGNPKTNTSFLIKTTGNILGLSVISAINLTNSNNLPTSGIFISFTQSGSSIIINNIKGLPVNDSFTIRIIAWA